MGIAWIYLIIAGLLEPCWVVSMKRSDRFRDLPWSLATVIFLAVSLYLLFIIMSLLPAGTAYAVWAGIGAVCTLIAGIVIFKERITVMRMLFTVLTVTGIVGLYVTAGV
ncbi:MAG: multidrug efflux SMR transporter [Methanomassiliicoccaceae archaeon]|nr:multidrug efflux SMR transporter [Methanomassiliicoccaceae archaeon]